MNRSWINTFLSYIVLLILQIFVFNKLFLGIYIYIMIYPVFILLLSPSFAPLTLLLLAAFMGLSIDFLSSGTLGLHMAACVAMAYTRILMFRNVSTGNDNFPEIPIPGKDPFVRVLLYSGVLMLVHHTILFTFDNFNFSNLLFIIFKILISGTINLSIILFFEYIFRNQLDKFKY